MYPEPRRNGAGRRRGTPVAPRRQAGPASRRWITRVAPLVAGAAAILGCAVPACADETLQQRAERLARMSDAEKMVLLQKKDRFTALPPEEQQRLREIHDQLSRDPDAAQLQQVLQRYYDWLSMLTAPEQAKILSLPADQRIEKIRELVRAQDARRVRAMASGFQMSPRDLEVIHDWFHAFLEKHAQEILDRLPDPPFGHLKKTYDHQRDHVQLGWLYVQSMSPDLPRPSREEERQLEARVSKHAREVLDQAGSDEARSRIIRWWIGAAVLSRRRISPSIEELHEFAQKSLSDDERARLESLPVEQMYRDLRILFYQHRYGADRGRLFPWGPRGGGRLPGPEGTPGFGSPLPGGPGPWGPPGPLPPEPREAPADGPGPAGAPARVPGDPGR